MIKNMINETSFMKTLKLTVVAAAVIFIYAMIFLSTETKNVNWGFASLDGYPLIERYLNPDFIKNDFFTNASAQDFSARTYYAKFIAFLSNVSKIQYYKIIGVLNILRNLFLFLSVYYFVRKVFKNKSAALFAVILTIMTMTRGIISLCHWGLSTWDLTASAIVTPFLIIGLALTFENRIFLPLMLAGVSSLFHPILGGEAAVMYVFCWGSDKFLRKEPDVIFKNKWFHIGGIVFTIFFMLSFFPYLNSTTGIEKLSAAEFLKIIGAYRHPSHYIPSAKPAHFLYFILTIITAFFYVREIGFKNLKEITSDKKYQLMALATLMLSAIIAGYVFVEILPVKIVITAIPYRITLFLNLFLLGLGGLFITNLINKNLWLPALLTILGYFYVLNHFIFSKMFFILTHAAVFIIIDLIKHKENGFLTTLNRYVSNIITFFLKYISKLTSKKPLTAQFFIPAVFILTIPSFFIFKVPYDYLKTSNSFEIFRWIKKNTPENAVFTAPPQKNISMLIRLLSKRAVLVDFAFPFNEKYYREWYDRALMIYGPDFLKRHQYYKKLNRSDFKTLYKKYNVKYAVVQKEKTISFPVVFSGETYKIVDLSKSLSR